MLVRKSIFQFIVVAIFAITGPFAQADDSLVREVERGMALWNVPGMAVAIVGKDKVHFRRGFGDTTIVGGSAVDEHTLFAIASTTKAMIAAGMLMLADEGKLSIDDNVIKYIPELHFQDAALAPQLTIRDLLSHRTGLPSTDLWAFLMEMPLDEQIRRFQSVPSAAPPRSRFIYQNTMYELVGLIIERVSGKSWQDFLTERLWHPIGMLETYPTRGSIPEDRAYVLPHNYIDDKIRIAEWDLYEDHADAAGSVWSSVHDMSLWAQFLLRGAETASGTRLISPSGVDEMFTPQQVAAREDFYPLVEVSTPSWRTYGLAWFQRDFQGRKIDFHTGSLSGLIALIGLDRAGDNAIVVLGNRDHAEMRHALLWYVMDESVGKGRRDWNQEIWNMHVAANDADMAESKSVAAKRLTGTRPILELPGYAGTYSNDTLGDVGVEYRDGQLVLEVGKYSFAATHWHYDVFQISKPEEAFEEFISFAIGADGEVAAMRVFGLEFAPAEM